MNDRIDPGPGWRLLKVGEAKPQGYEYKSFTFGWIEGEAVGQRVRADGLPCRVRVAPLATKAIAILATVKAAFPDGVTSESIACKTGLSGEMMQYVSDRWNLASKHLPTSGARYIMLEIQREGEP